MPRVKISNAPFRFWKKPPASLPANLRLREPVDIALVLTLVNAYVHADRRKEALELSRRLEADRGYMIRRRFLLSH